jgi:predicted Ser/Thr protein kinase
MSGMLPLRDTDPREVSVYRLLGRLGEGGQGVVFLAVGPTGSRAAVKLLAPTTDPQVRSRFLKEVAATQRVARFCTAQVLDAGIFERRPFIVSEYISGPSLVEVIEQVGPRGGKVLERIAIATLTALGAVHGAGMVHRDFKPGNVLLGPDGPVVIDFGLAAVPGMTTTGPSGQVAVGTPVFMAPEHLAGTRVTAAADMWSWGVTMAFTGTGELPFKGESLTATAYAILHSEPKVGRLPEPLGSLVHRCLDKNPAARPSARTALSELAAAGAQLIGPMPPIAPAPDTDDKTAAAEQAATAPPEPAASSGESLTAGGLASWLPWRRRENGRTSWRLGAAALLTLLLLVAGGLAIILSQRGPPLERPPRSHPRIGQFAPEAAARAQAIAWILHQASPAAFVACDAVVCGDLTHSGFPSSNLIQIGPASNDPLDSNLVVATAVVRNQFGRRLAVWAPAILASFGTGNARIDIRWAYPGGATAYRPALRSSLRARKAADAQLLTNRSIRLSATAKAQLRSGQVDPRLPLLIDIMAHTHPLRVVDFASQSPGGGPASLLRWMDLATATRGMHLTHAAYLGWMRSFFDGQRAEYHPDWIQQVRLPDGKAALRIGYGAPGLLNSPG